MGKDSLSTKDFMSFTPDDNFLSENKPIHGFSEEQVYEITEKYKELVKRDLYQFPTTKEEFANIVVPYQYIIRESIFELNKEKPKVVKPKKEKVVKPKKLTKKFIKEEGERITWKEIDKIPLTQEEEEFKKNYMGLL